MYQFSGKLKIAAIVLMVLGLGLTVISFNSAPKTLEEAKAIMAEQAATHGHGNTHGSEASHGDTHHGSSNKSHDSHYVGGERVHDTEKSNSHNSEGVQKLDANTNGNESDHKESTHSSVEKVIEGHTSKVVTEHSKAVTKLGEKNTNSHAQESNQVVHQKQDKEESVVSHGALASEVTGSNDSHKVVHATDSHKASAHGDSHHDDHHAEHVFHQMQNRPVAAFYVAMLFFLGITLLVMAFYAAQRVAQAGWSVVLFRVFEAITNNLHYVSVFMLLFIIGTALHKFHLFPWMKPGTFDPQSDNYDAVVDAKKWWMNESGWIIRSIIYLTLWNVLRFIIRRKSIKQDNGDLALHKNLYNWCVGFIVIFMVTESMMSWDWIMGIDPHWFSTLFGWYVLATFLVCALTVVAMVSIYLKSKGVMPFINESHIHDLTKFMFGLSVFWTYLWFAQFMLIWYADMPEETVYYLQRFNEYKVPFLGMIGLNFVFPVLLLLNSDFKSMPWFVVLGGIAILIGHYIDLFVMIMPGTVGGQWGFGLGELGGLFFFAGLFIYATFSAFAKANPLPKGSPFLHESETHHYYIIEHRGEDSHDHH